MEDIYQNFSLEELKDMLLLKIEMLSEIEKSNRNLESIIEALLKEIDELTVQISELGEKNTLLNEELAAFKESEEEDDPGGGAENENCIDNDEALENDDGLKKLTDYKKELYRQCKAFLESTSFSEFSKEIGKMVIGQDISVILASVYKFIEAIVRDRCEIRSIPGRILMSGPSGCGKSHIARSLSRYFNGVGETEGKIPLLKIIQIDVSRCTQSGFRGRSIEETIVSPDLLQSEGLAIVFLSEFDKLCAPKHSSKENVSEGVMGELLSFIEGTILKYRNAQVATTQTLFICEGSFSGIRDAKKRKSSEKTVGFITQDKKYDVYDTLSREDLIEFGVTYELVGRFSIFIQLQKLCADAVFMILMGYQKQISKNLGIEVSLSNEYIVELMNEANGPYGCRLLYSKIYEICMKAVAEALSLEMEPGFKVNIFAGGKYELRPVDETMRDFAPDFLTSVAAEEIGWEEN